MTPIEVDFISEHLVGLSVPENTLALCATRNKIYRQLGGAWAQEDLELPDGTIVKNRFDGKDYINVADLFWNQMDVARNFLPDCEDRVLERHLNFVSCHFPDKVKMFSTITRFAANESKETYILLFGLPETVGFTCISLYTEGNQYISTPVHSPEEFRMEYVNNCFLLRVKVPSVGNFKLVASFVDRKPD